MGSLERSASIGRWRRAARADRSPKPVMRRVSQVVAAAAAILGHECTSVYFFSRFSGSVLVVAVTGAVALADESLTRVYLSVIGKILGRRSALAFYVVGVVSFLLLHSSVCSTCLLRWRLLCRASCLDVTYRLVSLFRAVFFLFAAFSLALSLYLSFLSPTLRQTSFRSDKSSLAQRENSVAVEDPR